MRTRLRALGADGVQAHTFHAAALRQAQYFWPQVYGGAFPQITASEFALVAEAGRPQGPRTHTPLFRDPSAEIEGGKGSNNPPAPHFAPAGPAPPGGGGP